MIEIGDKAFLFCDSLIDIQLPTTLERIGKGAFGGCKKLTSITMPEVLIEIANPGVVSNMESVFLSATAVTCDMDFQNDCVQHEILWDWSCTEGHLSEPGALRDAAETSLHGTSLLIRAGSLISGQKYKFRAQATVVSGAIGIAEISLQVGV